jgi:hypothetical protein
LFLYFIVTFLFELLCVGLAPYNPAKMDFDDDAPPDLVETTGAEIEEEEKPVKVPITIVTGNLCAIYMIWELDTNGLA